MENVNHKHSKARQHVPELGIGSTEIISRQFVHQFSNVVLGDVKQWLAEKLTNTAIVFENAVCH